LSGGHGSDEFDPAYDVANLGRERLPVRFDTVAWFQQPAIVCQSQGRLEENL
jgi:hypothetical protein